MSIGSKAADSIESEHDGQSTGDGASPRISNPAHIPQIEDYEILDKLGEAGQGQIWRALQISTNRHVALKVPRTTLISSEKALARFEREVELAAGLKHPNIARIHDSGIHQGIYYYAMDLVEGIHLDEYVKKHNMTIRQILKLMQTICQAVQHAHQNGVIHRDLKPSNIVVSENGQPYIVDFGLAKSFLDDDLNLTVSADGETAGTPAYMSPEQAAGHLDKLDTRTDVYNLGVILFTLLTGESPHDLSGTRHEIMHRIIHQEVKRPHKVCPKIDKELELLLLKALDNDPDMRYVSAGSLAKDIDNYLTGSPLQAVPASSTYQLKKFIRRNRTLAASIAVVVAVSIAGAAVSTSFALRAKQEAKNSKAISDFLRDDLLAAASPYGGAQRGSSLESILDIAAENLEDKFQEMPLVEASIRYTIGRTYRLLGNYEPAESNLKRAIQLRQEALGTRDLETFICMRELGWMYSNQGRNEEAEPILVEAVEGLQAVLDDTDSRLLGATSELAWMYWRTGRPDQAGKLQEEALEVVQRKLGPEHPYVPNHMEGLAAAYEKQGHVEEAEKWCRKALDISRRTQEEGHSETMNITNYLGELCQQLGRHNEAVELFREVLGVRRQQLGEIHPKTLKTVRHLGSLYREMKRFDGADQLLTEALDEINRSPSGEGRTWAISLMFELARVHTDQGQYVAAERWFLEANKRANQRFKSDKRAINKTVYNLIEFYEAWGKPEEAEKWRAKLSKIDDSKAR